MKINSNLETILPNLTNEQKLYISDVFLAIEHTEACLKLSELLFDEGINLTQNYERKIKLNAAYALAIRESFNHRFHR